MAIYGTNNGETINGTNGNDIIYGQGGDDIIIAGAGDDLISGGAGEDTMQGGQGNDTYVVNSETETVIENANEGYDTVLSYSNFTLSGNIERLEMLGNFNTNGTGNALNNYILGSTGVNILSGGGGNDTINAAAGDDTIDGGDGNDYIDGGTGADTMSGGLGNDIFIVDNANDTIIENLNEGFDTAKIYVDYTLAANIERAELMGNAHLNLIGSNGNDIMVGNVGNNQLTGGDGHDILNGSDGNDILDSGAGNDLLIGGSGTNTMVGGTGNDTYVTYNANDTLTENANEGYDTVKSNVTFTLGDNFEKLELFGNSLIDATGNELNNVIIGNSRSNVLNGLDGNDILNGGAGNDTLNGGNGNDLLNGGTGSDTMTGGSGDDIYMVDIASDVVIEQAGEGYDTVLSYVSYTMGDNIEKLELLGSENLTATGNDGNNIILGNSGNNTIIGGAGNDILNGGDGYDTYLMSGNFGFDTITGNNTDVITFTDLNAQSVQQYIAVDTDNNGFADKLVLDFGNGNQLSINGFFNNTAGTIHTGNGTVNSFGFNDVTYDYSDMFAFAAVDATAVYGTNGDDVETLSAVEDLYYALDGNDEIYAQDGNDTVYGGLGDDFIDGETGDDTLYGGIGEDELLGGEGNDTIFGDDDFDWIEGGDGNDTLNGGNGEDIIYGDDGNDIINGDAACDYLYGGLGTDTIHGNSGDDYIEGNEGNDTLYGDDGDDVLDGGEGADHMEGGLGNDIYEIDDINDVVVEHAGEGIDTIGSMFSYSLAGTEVENLSIWSSNGDTMTGTGNDYDNQITGGRGSDTLWGGLGNDILKGNHYNRYNCTSDSQADSLHGEQGNDWLYSLESQDKLYGGTGDDHYIHVDMGNGIAQINENAGEGYDIVWIEKNDYSIAGNANLEGVILWGDSDTDATGNALDNTMGGNQGDNLLAGGDGNDTYLYNYTGYDQITWSSSDSIGHDIISDSSGGNDILNLSHLNQAAISTWEGIDSDSNGFMDQLLMTISANETITIENFFDNTVTELAGNGAIEDFVFADGNLNFGDVQGLLT